jgi:hypothetical protein
VQYKSGLIREVSSLERDNLLVFYYFSATDIWPHKRGVFLLRETIYWYFTISVQLIYGLIREVSSLEGGQFTGILLFQSVFQLGFQKGRMLILKKGT